MTFDNRPRRTASDDEKRARTGAASRSNTRKTDDGRVRAQSSGTARPRVSASARTAGASGSAGAKVRPAQRTAPGGARQSARPAQSRKTAATKNKKPAWLKKRLGGFDLETILALALIIVVLGGIIGVTVMLISSASEKNTTYVPRTEIANIVKEEDLTSQQAAANTQSGQAGGDTPGGSNALATVAPQVTISSVGTTSTEGLRSCRIRTVGDFVFDKNILSAGKAYASANGSTLNYDFSGMLSVIAPYLADADFTVANVDGSMGGKYRNGYTGYPQINTPESLIINLKDAGVDMLTLANNHMLDGWYDGLLAEIDNVDAAGLYHIGASRTQEERDTPLVIEINGIKVGFMNYTESLNNFENYGVDKRALEFGTNWTKNSNCTEDAKRLRDAGAEVIVCYMHWGDEYTSTPNKSQTDLAQRLMKAGVDIIVGGHPHVAQKAEWITGTNQFGEAQRTFCIYSLGNFLTEHTSVGKDGSHTDGGLIFDFTIQEKGDGTFEITAPSYITTYVWKNGNDIFGRGYVVVPCAMYINSGTRPSGMTDAEYNAMVASHNAQVATMNQGVGAQKTN